MPSQYNSETKAQVLALVRQGETAQRAAGIAGVPERTAQAWASRMRQIAAEQDDRLVIDEDYRLAIRSSELIHDAYDYLAEDETGERQAKALIPLNAIRGTAIDKIIKRNQGSNPSQSGVFIITQGSVTVSSEPPRDIIEAEVRHAD